MDRDGVRRSWAVVLLSAVLTGACAFLVTSLANSYLLSGDDEFDAASMSITLTLTFLLLGAAERQGWFPPRARRRREER